MGLAPVNTIILIESLNPDERNTGLELYNDVIIRYKEFYSSINSQPLITRYFKVSRKNELLALLENLAVESSHFPKGILIHIETHGSDDKKGLVLSTEEAITWREVQDILIKINFNSENQFFLSMATCFGNYIHETIDHNLIAPFCAFISASEVVTNSEIVENFEPYFRELVRTRDAIQAYTNSRSDESKFYYKDVEKIYQELVAGIREQYDDPMFRREFYQEVNLDFKKQFDKEISMEEFDVIFKRAFNDRVNQLKNVFLFGKGRKSK